MNPEDPVTFPPQGARAIKKEEEMDEKVVHSDHKESLKEMCLNCYKHLWLS